MYTCALNKRTLELVFDSRLTTVDCWQVKPWGQLLRYRATHSLGALFWSNGVAWTFWHFKLAARRQHKKMPFIDDWTQEKPEIVSAMEKVQQPTLWTGTIQSASTKMMSSRAVFVSRPSCWTCQVLHWRSKPLISIGYCGRTWTLGSPWAHLEEKMLSL